MMPYEDESFWNIYPIKLEEEIPDQDDVLTPKEGYEFLGMEFPLPRVDGYQQVTADHINQSTDSELIGHCNDKPILYTRFYEAVFPGKEGMEVYANILSKYTLTSCDAEGN